MKRFCQAVLFALFLSFFSLSLSAQEIEYAARFANGGFTTGNNISRQNFKKEDLQPAFYKDTYFVLVQFSSIPTKKQRLELKTAGVELTAYIPGNAYLATIKNNFDFTVAKKFNIVSVNTVPASYKIDPKLSTSYKSFHKENEQYISVSYYASFDRATVQKELQQLGAIVMPTKFDSINVIFIQADQSKVNAIAALPFVSYISLQTIKDKPLNYNDVAAHGISGLNAIGGKNLKGEGVTIGIGDNSDISTHIDFAGRLISRTPWYPDDHGTHVAGTMAGAGIIDIKNHGMAPRATIIDQYFSDIITQAPAYVIDYNMIATNNSYYSGADGCPGEGVYDNLSNYADWQLKKYDELIHVIAAGNDGGLTCSPYPNAFGTIKSGWQIAKDVLTVGALSTFDYTIAYFSSRGPTNDGRLKPEISSGGWDILSTFDNNGYGADYGTSMASPVLTGSFALMYQRYRQLHNGANPKAALMKALVCNTAEDLGNPGPDYTFGYGMLNARRAVEAIDSNWYFIDSLETGANNNYTLAVPSGARRLKIMLYWTDTAAAINAANTLVNDLDLTVTEPSSIVHHPLILNPDPAHVNDVAIEGADHTNNIEQVDIENPAGGNYTINVNGYAVPFGPQDYAVTYEIVNPSVTVEYPYGGETFVPGETEILRWNGYGNEGNNYTIQYSGNNGRSWTTISDSVPSISLCYSWVVPSTVTDSGLIRVTRNGTSLAGQSHFNFCILGRPVVTASNVCEGYAQLNWGSISGATSYDVMKLAGDSMQVFANTTDTFFLLKGLNKNSTYWLGVSAKNGATEGRRSLSVSIIPNSGACTLSTFNNDIGVDSILQPNTARRFFSNAANATAPLKIHITNLGSIPVTGPFTVSYSYEGGSATENVNATIPAGGAYTYTFATPYVIDSTGFHYHFKAWATYPLDSNHQNDTSYKEVKLLANPAVTVFPVFEGFETADSATYTSNKLGLRGDDALDFSTNTIKGRARTFVDAGFARTGVRALTLDQWPADSVNSTTDSLIVNYNLTGMDTAVLRFDFYYKNQGQPDYPGNKVWIRGSENDPWIQVYDLYANQAGLGEWQHGTFSINDSLRNANPPQTVSSTFQMKFGEQGFTSANSPYPEIAIDNGYSFDDLTLNDAINDVAVMQIISPDKTGCALTSSTPVTIQIRNYSHSTLKNLLASYQVNSGVIITDTIPSIVADTIINYTFNQTADFSAYTWDTVGTWVKYAGDNYPNNDSIVNYVFHNSPVISNYPYLQGFENSDGDFYTGGINSSWQWGTPSKPVIYKAANGKKAWITNLTGNYNDDETSYLYSPCFNLNGLVHPMLSFSDIYQVEPGYDYTWAEYSTDGINWQKLGNAVTGTNWYNDSVDEEWNGISFTKWHVASIPLPVTETNIRFRFVLSSDEGVTYDGLGIDDIHVFDAAPIYTGTPLTGITQNVNGNNWIDFNDPEGNRIVSINPSGMDLGNTSVQVYPYPDSVRIYKNQYFLNRNIVVQPTNAPTGNVGVRFYFTDAEADSLINQTGCASCLIPPTDPYVLNITKYSGSTQDENGTLNDDSTGFFQYFSPDSNGIVPYNTGYYAEFTVNSFSEFWLDSGSIKNNQPVSLDLLYFNAIKQGNTALLQWNTQAEVNIAGFIVERSVDGINYSAIGNVKSTNFLDSTNQYSFVDANPLAGVDYYRLEMVNSSSNAFQYSPVRELYFNDVSVYPNPVTNSTISVASFDNATAAIVFDASGRRIKSYVLQGKYNLLNLISLAKGVYVLKVFTATTTYTGKILIQ